MGVVDIRRRRVSVYTEDRSGRDRSLGISNFNWLSVVWSSEFGSSERITLDTSSRIEERSVGF